MTRNRAELRPAVYRLSLTVVFCAVTATVLWAQGVPFATLHYFDGEDGVSPLSTLLRATDGYLYGTTATTVFRISLTGSLTTLHTFDNTEGLSPRGALIQAADGNFYGTTNSGGLQATTALSSRSLLLDS
jgi:hypothetical protein